MRAHKLDIFDGSSNTLTVDELTLNGRSITNFSEILEERSSTRQTYLSGPDLIGVDATSTVETAATKTGDLRSTYHDLGVDMLTGSRGGMVLFKNKLSSLGTVLQTSILNETQNYLLTNTTDDLFAGGNLTAQFLATGLQTLDSSQLSNSNLYAFQTTKREVINGVLWEWNPESGFAMWRYTGTGSAFNLQHPMGKAPMFFAIKDLDASVENWVTGRGETQLRMFLNDTSSESENTTIFATSHTDTYLGIGTHAAVNTSSNEYFGFGWFGDPLDDLEVGMVGERGVTASIVVPANSGSVVVDTGVTNIQTLIRKGTNTASSWLIRNKASGFNYYTLLNTADAEVDDASITVNGSEITVPDKSFDQLVIVIGSTADRPDNLLKEGTKVLRKVGTAATGHRVDLGPMAGGTAGGMVMGRPVVTAQSNLVADTLRGATHYIYTDAAAADAVAADAVEAFLSTGIQLGANNAINKAELCQYTAFLTTHQTTESDGTVWWYNPLTGFAMCKYTGDGISTRAIEHPMNKVPRMLWHKNLDQTDSWAVYLTTLGASVHLELNTTSAVISTPLWTSITNVRIRLTDDSKVNALGEDYILYGWFGDDLSDIETGLTGERGVSAFYQYTGGSGAVSFDTGIDNIGCGIIKASSETGNWLFMTDINSEGSKIYPLSNTTAESTLTDVTIEGSIVSFTGSASDIEFIFFGSKADSGVASDITLPATTTNPAVITMANGVSDITKTIETSLSIDITGNAGKKYIYMKSDGLLYFTAQRPEYSREYTPYAKGNHVFDIKEFKMYNASGVNEASVFLGECMVDSTGNVYDIVTYSQGSYWDSGWWVPLSNSMYYFDNPFGHIEIDIDIYTIKFDYVQKQSVIQDTNGDYVGAHSYITPDLNIRIDTFKYPAVFNNTVDGMKVLIKRRF